MLSNSAWGTVDDIQSEVERRVAENKPSKSQSAKNLPFPRYLHVADTAYSHGTESLKKNELDRAYYYYYFYVSLIVNVLPKHPGYDVTLCADAKKKCVELLDLLTPIKEKLRVLYDEQRVRTAVTPSSTAAHVNSNGELHLPSVPLSEPGDDSPPVAALHSTHAHSHASHSHSPHAHSHSHSNGHANGHASGGGVLEAPKPLSELKLPLLTALTELPKNVHYEETHCCSTIYPTGRMIRSNLTIPRPPPQPLLSIPSPVSVPVAALPSSFLASSSTPATASASAVSAPLATAAVAAPPRVATPEPPPSFTGDSPESTPLPKLLSVPSSPHVSQAPVTVPLPAVASLPNVAVSTSTSSSSSGSTVAAAVAQSPLPSSSTSSLPVTPVSASATSPSVVTTNSSTSHTPSTPAAQPRAAPVSVQPPTPSASFALAPPSSSSVSSVISPPSTPHAFPATAAPLPIPSAAGRALAPPLPTNVTKRPAAPVVGPPVVAVPPPIRKPKRLTSDGLRNMVLFAPMFVDFMAAAERNTRWAIETCGILAGVESDDGTIFITHLIIPKQIGKSDSVVTTHEEEVFMFQEQHGLLTFGWIHTHPTHDLFMSSVDLHTHYSYQSMMREAIAIVIAPLRSPNFGIFRLTEPDGMQEIGNCTDRGFHPHSGRETLYKVCEHTTLEWGDQHRSRYKVVDQRV